MPEFNGLTSILPAASYESLSEVMELLSMGYRSTWDRRVSNVVRLIYRSRGDSYDPTVLCSSLRVGACRVLSR